MNTKKNISCILFFASCFLFADSVNAKECNIIEPETVKRHITSKTILNMIMFDIRPRFDMRGKRKFDLNTNIKRIPFATPAPFEDIKKELTGKIDELIGKDVILVGEDTESAESACRYMLKKDIGFRNIYVLKGGVKEWDGPVAGDITQVECEMITSRQLMNIIKSGRELEVIDQRQADEYHEGHIPGARLDNRKWDMQPPLKYRLQKRERYKKWEQENTTVVYVYPDEFQAVRDCRYVKYFSWGYKDIYVLRGGMKVWEGEVEKDYLEILKNKVKERLK